jgi:pimeloyl-ACP methyl ester carboxylesterase
MSFESVASFVPENKKPTILVLGGTPSTVDVLNQIPDSLKKSYHFISFNRPGFGGTKNAKMTKKQLIKLANKAGLKKNDFGIIGISGGAPLAIILADAFKVKHCGIISGMVSNDAYFKFADATFTKSLFELVNQPYEKFEKTALDFPNIDSIVLQAGTKTKEEALRASYNELNFILSKDLYSNIQNKSFSIHWWHGENDKNVALESVKLFLKDYPNSDLQIVLNADHGLDGNLYLSKILDSWK